MSTILQTICCVKSVYCASLLRTSPKGVRTGCVYEQAAAPLLTSDKKAHMTEYSTVLGDASLSAFRYLPPLELAQFLPCDAMRCTVSVIVILSVCLCVCPSVRLSVCHTRGLCPHGSTYDHDFFTVW